MKLPDEMTYGEAYGPAMRITDEAEAQEYFAALVARNIRVTGNSDEEAERIERINVGYWAGYYDAETMERVNRLFHAPHPIFGASQPSPKRAFDAGQAMGELMQAAKGATVEVEAFGRAWQAAQSSEEAPS